MGAGIPSARLDGRAEFPKKRNNPGIRSGFAPRLKSARPPAARLGEDQQTKNPQPEPGLLGRSRPNCLGCGVGIFRRARRHAGMTSSLGRLSRRACHRNPGIAFAERQTESRSRPLGVRRYPPPSTRPKSPLWVVVCGASGSAMTCARLPITEEALDRMGQSYTRNLAREMGNTRPDRRRSA